MPRYYFALTDGDLSLADDEIGEEFDLVEAARGHDVAVAREIVAKPTIARPGWALYLGRRRARRRSLQGASVVGGPFKDRAKTPGSRTA